MTKQTLFNVEELETNPNYVSLEEKKKWNKAFNKWILDEYDKNNGLEYGVHCGDRNYCDLCEQRYCNGCSDCLISLKKFCKKNNIDIDYRDYDFQKLIYRIEEA